MSNYKDLESPLLHRNSALNVYGIKQKDLSYNFFSTQNLTIKKAIYLSPTI